MFEKNLAAMNNPTLKRRLEKISPIESRVGVSYCVTPSGDYVLLKNDVPADDLNNPREAVKKMLSSNIKNEMKSNDIIVVFGIGLGYILDEVFNAYPSKIYLYEPDLNLLHFVLNNVDISEHLASGRVFMSNDMNELVDKVSSSYLTKDKVEIVYLQNYALVKNKELLLLTQKVYDACKSKLVDVNTINRFSKVWMENSIENIATVNNGTAYKLSDLAGRFIGQTALIAGAGPSLNDNISKIQANRNKFVIFAVNKSVKYLLQNGITPDFVVCLDARNMVNTLGGFNDQLSKSNCIMDIRSDKAISSLGFGKIFVSFAETDFFAQKLTEYHNDLKFYESGGTAASLALTAAVKLGFSKIVLTGVDLAFKDNTVYANGEMMNRVSQEEIIVDNVKKPLIKVRSVNNDMVYSRGDYEAFVHHFEELIKSLNYSEIYNTTSFGAYIEGVKNVSFEDLNLFADATLSPLKDVQPFKFELKEFMQDEFCHINEIISMLSKGVFSPALVNSIVKSVLIYQYMQTHILKVLQQDFAPDLAEDFINKTKAAIKSVVEELQRTKLI